MVAAQVASAVSDDGSVILDVKHGTEGAYICECRFSKMTFLREQDKYMVSNIDSILLIVRHNITNYRYFTLVNIHLSFPAFISGEIYSQGAL